jgi:hypothetical protein
VNPGATKGSFSKWWHAPFLSPKDLARSAILIALLYGILTAAGLREYTSILSGTVGSIELGWQISAFLGFAYLFAYLAFVLVAPVLLIAAVLLWFWQKLFQRSPREIQTIAALTSGRAQALKFARDD